MPTKAEIQAEIDRLQSQLSDGEFTDTDENSPAPENVDTAEAVADLGDDLGDAADAVVEQAAEVATAADVAGEPETAEVVAVTTVQAVEQAAEVIERQSDFVEAVGDNIDEQVPAGSEAETHIEAAEEAQEEVSEAVEEVQQTVKDTVKPGNDHWWYKDLFGKKD